MMKRRHSLISIAMATIMLISLCAMCASTSVSANPIPANTSPSVCIPKDSTYQFIARPSGSEFLFVKGYDGALWYNREDENNLGNGYDGWGGWHSLGGVLTSSPAAVASGSSNIAVFVRGSDGCVWSKTTTNNGASWSGWVSLGGQISAGTGPAACSWGLGRLDVFVQGTNGALYHKSYGNTWSGWENLGGVLTSSPAAASRWTGLIDVHYRGTNGADYCRSYYDGVWHSPVNLGGVIASGSGPAVSVWQYKNWGNQPADREDVFVKGTDGRMYNRTWWTSGWSPSWINLSGQLTSSPTAAMEGYSINVWARFTNGFLMLKEYYDGTWQHEGTWQPWNDGWMGGSIDGPPGML